MANIARAAAPSASKESDRPKKWWPWLLALFVLTAAVLAVLGAIPTARQIAKSYRYNVPYEAANDAEQQNNLWHKNKECLTDGTFRSITTENDIEISSLVCNSGDMLVVEKRSGWQSPRQRWISWSDVLAEKENEMAHTLINLSPAALAAWRKKIQLVQTDAATLTCEQWVGKGLLLEHIRTAKNVCFDQVVNTFTGVVVSSTPVPCIPAC